jgi:alkanesulfonate monooxygenase SsuD/methylene tetrahydromethanopterin reductase-like flavin-dependent oxidoreductase (luciferase family)
VPDLTAPIRFGANCWNQYTDWPTWLSALQDAEALGYDSLWTWDHLYPIVGSHEGPILEAYTALAALAVKTSRATVGLEVGANTFRNPALVAKMITTIDHISGGRAVLGIGAAWFETEHRAFGIPFGASPGERLRWLGEALPVMRGMLDGTEPTAAGPHYAMRAVRNDPPPVQRHLPIVVGGSGRRVTLRLTARYADACNVGGTIEEIRDAEAWLVRHCEEVGRDEREIERHLGFGELIIRDSRAAAERDFKTLMAGHGAAPWEDAMAATPEDVVEALAPFIELGYRHVVFGFPGPFDRETMTRLAREVRPRLEAMVGTVPPPASTPSA